MIRWPRVSRRKSPSTDLPGWPGPNPLAGDDRSVARVLWIGRGMILVMTLALLALLGRVAQLQSRPVAPVAELLDSQQTASSIAGRRGSILDRHGRVFAATRVAHRLFVDSLLIVDRGTFSEHVGYNLGLNPAEVEQKLALRPRSRYIVLEDRLTDEQFAMVREMKLPGLATEPWLVRDYPQTHLAGQIVGFVGAEARGLDGLELHLDTLLRPASGGYQVIRSARRDALWIQPGTYRPSEDGQTLRLSLDAHLQSIAERELAATVEKFGAVSGQMVVMDPHSGAILAMANVPLFDPGDFRRADANLRRNRSVTDVFEPGSTFKPLVWAALTEAGAARIEEMIDCTADGVWRTDYGRRLRDVRGHGKVSWEEVLVHSSNIGMAKVAERVSQRDLYEIVRRFGFGQASGSGLPGEVRGLLNPLPRWTKYSQSSLPMGQEIGTTALQMVRAFATLANGGYLVTPSIQMPEMDAHGQPLLMPAQTRVLSPAIADHTRRVMRRVMEEGTGRRAQSEKYELFGKTGTAQLPDFEKGGYHQDRYVSSFIAGAPLDRPRLVIGCFIQEPDKKIGHYGGVVAGPPVRVVMEEALAYLGVPPTASVTTLVRHR